MTQNQLAAAIDYRDDGAQRTGHLQSQGAGDQVLARCGIQKREEPIMAIKKTKAGSHEVDWWVPTGGGKYKRMQKTFTKRKDAVAFYESTRTKVRNKEYVPPSKHLVKDMCKSWLEMMQDGPKIQTYLQLEGHVNNYIVSAFGTRRMTDLPFEEIENAGRRWAAEKKIQAKMVNKVFGTFSRVYRWARKFGVSFNPLEQVDRQKENK